ncbi:MAG: serine/threonine protein kinase [Labilithrix sp.]|nr:serine/threonine protein kinase [Labilithrix sp.]
MPDLSLSSELANASELFARRLRLFGVVLVVQIAFFVIVGNAVAMLHPTARWGDWLAPSNGLLIGAAVIFGVMAWLASPARPERVLRTADVAGTSAGFTLVASVAVYSPPVQRPELSVAIGLTLVLVLRAILVPSTWTRTARIGALCSAPAIAAALLSHADQPAGDWNLPLLLYPAIVSVWAALAVGTSTLASRIIFGLRARVDKAMRLGQYVLEEKIGEGGMGVVYRASHAMLRRPTAVKFLDPSRAGDDALVRFEREVRATSRLTHPNTVAVYDYGRTQEGTFYYAMELLEGMSLEQLVTIAGPLPPGRVIKLLDQICGSLAEAHDAGLVHRDVKPANVMVCARAGSFDVVKVLDFGLVKETGRVDDGARRSFALGADPARTEANVVMGTPLYLAPEAIKKRAIDARTDLYSLGCVAYFLLTGTDAFAAPTLDAVLERHLHEEPERLDARLREVHGRGVPADLEAVVLACLAKRPEGRPRDARAVRAALAQCADGASWSDDDARAWWEAHPRPAPPRDAAAGELTETLTIDWSSRVERGSMPPS